MGCQYRFLPPTPWHFLRPVSLLSDDRDVSGHSSIPGNLVPLLMKTSVTETWSLSATSCLVLSTWFLPPLFFCSVPLNVFSLDKKKCFSSCSANILIFFLCCCCFIYIFAIFFLYHLHLISFSLPGQKLKNYIFSLLSFVWNISVNFITRGKWSWRCRQSDLGLMDPCLPVHFSSMVTYTQTPQPESTSSSHPSVLRSLWFPRSSSLGPGTVAPQMQGLKRLREKKGVSGDLELAASLVPWAAQVMAPRVLHTISSKAAFSKKKKNIPSLRLQIEAA